MNEFFGAIQRINFYRKGGDSQRSQRKPKTNMIRLNATKWFVQSSNFQMFQSSQPLRFPSISFHAPTRSKKATQIWVNSNLNNSDGNQFHSLKMRANSVKVSMSPLLARFCQISRLFGSIKLAQTVWCWNSKTLLVIAFYF